MLTYQDLLKDLKEFQDLKYKEFITKILNSNIKVIGICSKDIKFLIKKYQDADLSTFELNKYHEVNFIYITISLKRLKTSEEQIAFIKENIDLIGSWEITDSTYQLIKFKTFYEAYKVMKELVNSKNEFLIRYGYLFMFFYYKEEKYFDRLVKLFKNSTYYYVEMVEGWVLSMLYLYHPKKTFEYLKNSSLSIKIQKIAIQKAIDSYRVSKEDKELIRNYRKTLK